MYYIILHKELREHRYLDAYMAFLHEGYAKKWHYEETTSRNGETTSHNGKTTSRNGETTSRNGEATSHNGKTTSHNGKTTSHNDESTSHNGETPSYNDETTSRNGETRLCNNEWPNKKVMAFHAIACLVVVFGNNTASDISKLSKIFGKFWNITSWYYSQILRAGHAIICL